VCGSPRGYMRQCMRPAVCAAVRQCAAVRAAVHMAVRAAVRQCVTLCAAVCGSVVGSVWQCGSACVAVRAAVCGSSAHDSVWQCTPQMYTRYYTKSLTICIGMPLQG
jgi:hypothetical protein